MPTRSLGSPPRGPARRLACDTGGSIAITAAICLLLLMGAAALAVDLAQLYLTKANDQRIADQSALAAGFAYSQSGGSSATAQTAAASLAVSNGAGSSTVTATIVTSPSGDGNKAAMVTVQTPVSLTPFAQRLTATSANPTGMLTVTVAATSYAEIQSGVANCVTALGGGGISAIGGTDVTATNCAIGSGGSITATSGPTISAEAIYAVGSVSPSSCSGGSACVKTLPTAGQIFPGSSAPVDQYASAGVFSRLPTVAAMTPASFPSVGSAPTGGSTYEACSSGNTTLTIPSGTYTSVSTSYSPVCSTINFTGGGTTNITGGMSLTGPAVTINFAAGVYKINNAITTYGSIPVTMSLASGVTMYVWGGIGVGGSSSLTIKGPGTYYIQGSITNSSTGALTINNANGSGTSTFYIAGGISVDSTDSFPSGTYTITSGGGGTGAGINVQGSSTVTFGAGSFNIAGGITIGSSAHLTIGGALSGGSVFQIPSCPASGNAISVGGSSNFTIGSFTNYDLNCPVNFTGNISLGSGIYTINGAFDAGASGGNSITGTGVSIIASGSITFGNGYSSVNLSAPTTITSSTIGSADTIVLASDTTSGSIITQGATNTTVLGAVYIPRSAVTINGGGNLTGGGGCLDVIANSMALSGGGQITTDCSALSGGSGSSSIALVQ
jgi:Flp pilus assembly protein TadG